MVKDASALSWAERPPAQTTAVHPGSPLYFGEKPRRLEGRPAIVEKIEVAYETRIDFMKSTTPDEYLPPFGRHRYHHSRQGDHQEAQELIEERPASADVRGSEIEQNMNTTAHVLSLSCIVGRLVFFAGCSSAAQPHHPDAYQGGQYYGDAVHPENQEARPAAQ